MSFDDFVATRDAERSERDRGRVTWRRAHWYEMRRGEPERVDGYSGIGSGGRLVFVRFDERARRDEVYTGEWRYGTVEGDRRIYSDTRCRTFTEAKLRAAALLR